MDKKKEAERRQSRLSKCVLIANPQHYSFATKELFTRLIQTPKGLKRTLFIRTKLNQKMWGVIPSV